MEETVIVRKDKTDLNLHRMMCLIGGFMGAYAILTHCDNFGSAQTANMIYLIFQLLGCNFSSFLVRLGGLLIYFVGIELTVWLEKRTKVSLKRYALLVEGICILILAFLPLTLNPVLGLYPIFFMMSTQWCVFHGAAGYNSSTIFSTNNLKQFSLALGNYVLEKDAASRKKMFLFGNSLLFFHMGVAISFVACKFCQGKACLFAAVPLAVAAYLVVREERLAVETAKISAQAA